MFCDLVDSTALAERLDAEELREVVRAYQEVAVGVIDRFAGHVAQYLGDGLLVYFGYPRAHEDDAQRAVHAGLGILDGMQRLNARLQAEKQVRLGVRVGIHTGAVVVGEMGGGERRERLAMGDTVNIAARLQGVAEPGTVVISGATLRLTEGWFRCVPLGAQNLKGLSQPIAAYRVLGESGVQDRLVVATASGLTPLVGREQETALLLERWEAARGGRGHVVLLGGEAGIGKSRLARVLAERVASDAQATLQCGCSAHRANSAFSAVTDLLARVLRAGGDASDDGRLARLEGLVRAHALPSDAVALLAGLVGLPIPGRHALPAQGPERQRQRTQECVLAWLIAAARARPLLLVVEDLHWADPSTRELLGRLLDHLLDDGAAVSMLVLLTFRPEFHPPWRARAGLTAVTLNRLTRRETARLVGHVAAPRALAPALVEQLVTRTDGVPLYVEELTKMVLESDGGPSADGPLDIPATLRDSLMARLDRLESAKEVAQLAAALGREFPATLLRAVSPLDPAALEGALARLVDAEVLVPRADDGAPGFAFKHALIQEAAYESLLRSARQQHHGRIARVLEERFPALAAAQPEVLAHHHTEAGAVREAIDYWRRAAEAALERSANVEAVAHVARGMQLVLALPETPERDQQELLLQTTLGPALMATEGYGAPRVERTYARAWTLCQRVEGTPPLFPVMRGLNVAYLLQGKLQSAHELGERLLALARTAGDAALLVEAHFAIGETFLFRGDFALAHDHLEQAVALYDPARHREHAFRYGQDVGVFSRQLAGIALWYLGRPDDARARCDEALALARDIAHPNSLGSALFFSGYVHVLRREAAAARPLADALLELARAQGFPFWAAGGDAILGWTMTEDGRIADGIARMRDGLGAWRTAGAQLPRPLFLALLAEACGRLGARDDGLKVVDEAIFFVSQNGQLMTEAEVHRVRGELLAPGSPAEAEQAFRHALDVAGRQQARLPALRAATGLARLLRAGSGHAAACAALATVYDAIDQGRDLPDLRDAREALRPAIPAS